MYSSSAAADRSVFFSSGQSIVTAGGLHAKSFAEQDFREVCIIPGCIEPLVLDTFSRDSMPCGEGCWSWYRRGLFGSRNSPEFRRVGRYFPIVDL